MAAVLPVPSLAGGVLTMGGMAAARCFSCFRSRGFCGEEFSLASLAVLSRLGRGDSNLDTKHTCQLGNTMDKLYVSSLPHARQIVFYAAEPRGHPLHQRGACWTTPRCWESGLLNTLCTRASSPASCCPGPKPV